mmetsp:Transcript_12130/g.22714  ORF Transcript_12130/g.22714 Transcript_12130/m.22714 type:complete len:365 (-) Transcript_12130:855-1949(-)
MSSNTIPAASSATNTTDPSSSSFLTYLHPQRVQALNTFLASDTIVTIIPSFSYKLPPSTATDFLLTHESVGPFQAGIETTVPLWIAIHLRKRNLCKLKCPPWMQVENLKRILRQERLPENQQILTNDLPFRFAEISSAILQACGAGRSAVHASGGLGGNEEVPQAEVVRVLLEDISMVRMEKIRNSIHKISAEIMSEKLDRPMMSLNVGGMGSMEMAAIKPFLERAFEDHLKLVKVGTDADRRSGGMSVASGRGGGSSNNSSSGIVGRRRRTTTTTTIRFSSSHGNVATATHQESEQYDNNDEELAKDKEQMEQEEQDKEIHDENDNDDDDLEEPTADATAAVTTATNTTTTTTTRSNIRRYRS